MSDSMRESSAFTTELTPAETERLAFLMEEMAEAQHVIGKILRHGYASRDPTTPNAPRNRQLLEVELGHVNTAVKFMVAAKDINRTACSYASEAKIISVRRWLHYQVGE